MEFIQITENKKQYLQLLLLADEQESMIDRYLERGEQFVLLDDGVKAVCVVTQEGDRVCEIKNLAVEAGYQGKGYGKKMIEFVCGHYKNMCDEMLVGTADSPLTLPFYQNCGFEISHVVKDFFTNNYDPPIMEDGKPLTDMIYLKKSI